MERAQPRAPIIAKRHFIARNPRKELKKKLLEERKEIGKCDMLCKSQLNLYNIVILLLLPFTWIMRVEDFTNISTARKSLNIQDGSLQDFN